ncbi:Gfo/Idh/MocA family oxidoreductase [Roseivirga spongicola]|uniref:Gfo/Idh/MocA family protein n=1 Tax=Roseivirga spongicola TaxID=333140 RepID=UPI000D78F2FD|nr:Gfo/Idh/MocA family oxidoreductase [Roseivirga spongicola]PWL24771.1 MAG: oxidoreductase [Roseivirga sp. XM-24bin3]WPZ10874.1 Gfo/Idh/MocA family oxidoreductase [Roseivirga spongicola]
MSTQRKIRMGMMGGGLNSFIGIVHRIASYIGEEYTLVGGVFDSNFENGQKFAKKLELDLSRTYADIDTFVEKELALPAEERIEVVVVVTPNFLHYPMAKQLIENGFHVICEKPITNTAAEAMELESLTKKHGVSFALTHTYTGYPMVRQMKSMIAEGVLGKIQKVDAQYYQGWINPVIHDKEKRAGVWRLDPEKAGQSCCMGDIGVHAFNMVEYTTGLKTTKVLADLNTLYEDNPLDIDGTAMCQFDNGAKGLVRASQIATSEENNLCIAVYGTKAGIKWEQENPNYLYFMEEGKPVQVLKPGHEYNSELSAISTKIAPGHPEGIFDSMGNIYSGAAKAIRGEEYLEGAFPTVHEGVRGMKFIEAVLASSKNGNVWTEIED